MLNEFYNVMLRYKVDDETIQESVESFLDAVSLHVNTLSTIKRAWKLREKYQYSYFDSLILAAALECRCAVIHTEDMRDQQVIEDTLEIRNPFRG